MKKKILLCGGNHISNNIYDFLKKKNSIKHISVRKKLKEAIFIKNKKAFNNFLRKIKKPYDFIILVYWPYLVDQRYFAKFNQSINFHPSYLPFCKGWYPHVHAKINNFPYGVTLHKISNKTDGGDIWAQKKIKINFLESSTEIYLKALKEILKLFKKKFSKLDNQLVTKKQICKNKFHKKIYTKRDILKYDNLNLNKKISIKNFINLALAREFKGKSYLNFNYKKAKYNLKIEIKKI